MRKQKRVVVSTGSKILTNTQLTSRFKSNDPLSFLILSLTSLIITSGYFLSSSLLSVIWRCNRLAVEHLKKPGRNGFYLLDSSQILFTALWWYVLVVTVKFGNWQDASP